MDKALIGSIFRFTTNLRFLDIPAFTLVARIRDNADGPGFAFDAEGQRSQVGEALAHAHFLLLHVFATQINYFQLGAEEQLNALLEDYKACWHQEQPSTDADVERRL